MRPAVLDLFGEVPVSLGEVLAWMLAVPGLAPDSPRFGYYVRNYRVLEKIQAAKVDGTFEAIVGASPAPPPYRLGAALDAAQDEARHWRRLSRRRAAAPL